MKMMLVYSNYAVAFAIAAVICAILSLYAWHRRRTPGELYFALMMASAAVWALASALENTMAEASWKILFSKLSYLGISTIGPFWLLFCLEYCQRTRLLRSRWKPVIWVIPALTLLLVFTNEWHGLVWPSVTPVSSDPGALVVYTHGPAKWLIILYIFTLSLIGSVFLLGLAMQSFRRFSLPATTVLLGILAPWVANVLYMTGLNPIPGLDITPFGFTITGLLLTWAIFGQRLFDLVPVAREMLIQLVADGAIMIDDRGDIVETNPAARHILGLPDEIDDQDISKVACRWPAIARCLQTDSDTEEEIMIETPAGAIWLEVRASVLHDNVGRLAGRLVILRDISKRKRAEEELKKSNEALKREVAEKDAAREELRLSLDEKEVLLKEIHHRVKNNLQIVSSLLSLQTSSSGMNDPSAALQDSQNRIRSMALIHEKLYQSSDLASIDFGEYTRSLVTNLARSYTSGSAVKINLEMEKVMLDIDRAIPCGLIINELVSNSLKYAFRDGRAGEVTISLARSGGRYELTIGDNGTGLPPGLDFRNTTTLGLQLVNTLVDQLEGTIEPVKDTGTAFRISFPHDHE